MARRARERRRRLGRHAGQPLEHLDHRARLGRAQRRALDARARRRSAEGRSVAHLRRRRRRRRLAPAGARRALWLGPHLLGADPHGPGDRRAPAILAPRRAAAVRAGGGPASAVRVAAAAGGELRAAGAHRHRPGAAPDAADAQPGDLAGADRDPPPDAGHAARDPADDRRLPRSDAAHQLRRDEPGRPRAIGRRRRGVPAAAAAAAPRRQRAGGDPRGCGLPGRVRPRRRQLADRHQPGDVGDDAVDRGARRGRAADLVARRRRSRDAARLDPRPAVSRRASLHARRAGRVGVDRSRRRRAGRRRHGGRAPRPGASGGTGRDLAVRGARPRRGGGRRPLAARSAEPAMAACRHSAAAGPACRSTAAAPS